MRVLIGIDGSRSSADALGAVRLLSGVKEVILLHAVAAPMPILVTGTETYFPYYGDLERSLHERGERILTEAEARLPEGIEVVRRVVGGSAADAILAESEREQVDLVLVGARGLGVFRELLLGSVSHRVLYHASCPVMVVHGPVKPAARRVLAPVHGEADAARLVHFLCKRPFPGTLDICVLHVLPLADPLWPLDAFRADESLREAVEEASVLARDCAEELAKLGHRASGATGLGAASETILREAESQDADLVLMGARSQPEVQRVLLGSVSNAVVHRARCPVVILR